MAFLMKMMELQNSLRNSRKLSVEAKYLFDKEGIGQNALDEKLSRVSGELEEAEGEIAKFLEDKQSLIEEIEFLVEAFRMEYGTILGYRKYAAMIENEEVSQHFMKFGKEETKHANNLIKLIYKRGGTPVHAFKEESPDESLKKEDVLNALILAEKQAIAFYEDGLSKFGDAEFSWLIGNIKVEEVEHLKELEKLEDEFREKEIVLRHNPNFKWIDPYMGEPGDRAWIE